MLQGSLPIAKYYGRTSIDKIRNPGPRFRIQVFEETCSRPTFFLSVCFWSVSAFRHKLQTIFNQADKRRICSIQRPNSAVMSSKRAFAEVEPSGAPRDAGANKKRKAFNNTHYRTVKDGRHGAASGQTLNEVKKRARDIERRFAKGELPADVQRNLERELAHCRRQIEELTHKKKRSDMISRYHKVRFFGTYHALNLEYFAFSKHAY